MRLCGRFARRPPGVLPAHLRWRYLGRSKGWGKVVGRKRARSAARKGLFAGPGFWARGTQLKLVAIPAILALAGGLVVLSPAAPLASASSSARTAPALRAAGTASGS